MLWLTNYANMKQQINCIKIQNNYFLTKKLVELLQMNFGGVSNWGLVVKEVRGAHHFTVFYITTLSPHTRIFGAVRTEILLPARAMDWNWQRRERRVADRAEAHPHPPRTPTPSHLFTPTPYQVHFIVSSSVLLSPGILQLASHCPVNTKYLNPPKHTPNNQAQFN